jgi:RNase adapter protein RapZ
VSIELLLVTGMSGAGKTATGAVLEDLGWFVVDNLPPALLPDLVTTIERDGELTRLAVGVDVRGGAFFADLKGAVGSLADSGIRPRVLFLEANDDVLVRRFESVRRPHPLQEQGRVVDGIVHERALLSDLRATADLIIDTSFLNVHELAGRLRTAFADPETAGLRAIVVSFGYKYGIPADADLVADMRFLPNPHWVDELRPQTGLAEPVSAYVLKHPEAGEFVERYAALIGLVSAGYQREGKQFVTIGIGCTGGKHRSIAMAEALAKRLRDDGVRTLVVHRDLGRE